MVFVLLQNREIIILDIWVIEVVQMRIALEILEQ